MSEGCKNGYKTYLCRFCANELPGIDIFSHLGQEQKLTLKIQLCHLPFKITMTDILPAFLCYNCIKKLNCFYEFYNSIIGVQAKLKEICHTYEKKDSNTSTEIKSNCNRIGQQDTLQPQEIPLQKTSNPDCVSPPEMYTIDLSLDDDDDTPYVNPKKPKMVSSSEICSLGSTGGFSHQNGGSLLTRTNSGSNLAPPYPSPATFKVISPGSGWGELNVSRPDQRSAPPSRANLSGPQTRGTLPDTSSSTKVPLTMSLQHCGAPSQAIWTPGIGLQVTRRETSGVRSDSLVSLVHQEETKGNKVKPILLGTIDITGPKESVGGVLTIDITDSANIRPPHEDLELS